MLEKPLFAKAFSHTKKLRNIYSRALKYKIFFAPTANDILCFFHPDFNRWYGIHTHSAIIKIMGRGLRLLPITTSEELHLALKPVSYTHLTLPTIRLV